MIPRPTPPLQPPPSAPPAPPTAGLPPALGSLLWQRSQAPPAHGSAPNPRLHHGRTWLRGVAATPVGQRRRIRSWTMPSKEGRLLALLTRWSGLTGGGSDWQSGDLGWRSSRRKQECSACSVASSVFAVSKQGGGQGGLCHLIRILIMRHSLQHSSSESQLLIQRLLVATSLACIIQMPSAASEVSSLHSLAQAHTITHTCMQLASTAL